ncbi:hypothetical protein AB1Y20_012241 [Prymnesium parvum]|uniref:Uncharacterized protein n=1 Tax=Prymnesium parvum TaxID=97485 RepID=A0AB34IR94_PRYPA
MSFDRQTYASAGGVPSPRHSLLVEETLALPRPSRRRRVEPRRPAPRRLGRRRQYSPEGEEQWIFELAAGRRRSHESGAALGRSLHWREELSVASRVAGDEEQLLHARLHQKSATATAVHITATLGSTKRAPRLRQATVVHITELWLRQEVELSLDGEEVGQALMETEGYWASCRNEDYKYIPTQHWPTDKGEVYSAVIFVRVWEAGDQLTFTLDDKGSDAGATGCNGVLEQDKPEEDGLIDINSIWGGYWTRAYATQWLPCYFRHHLFGSAFMKIAKLMQAFQIHQKAARFTMLLTGLLLNQY